MPNATSFPPIEGFQIILFTILIVGGFATWLYRDAGWGDTTWKVIQVAILSILFCLGLHQAVSWLDSYLAAEARSGSGFSWFFWFFLINPLAQADQAFAGLLAGSDETISFTKLAATMILSAGMFEEFTKLLLAMYLMGRRREGYPQIASATILSGLAFGAGESAMYFWNYRNIVWTEQLIWQRACLLPLLHASWVFLNGMLCLPKGNPLTRALGTGPLLFIFYLGLMLLPGATLHGLYDAIVIYQALNPSQMLRIVQGVLTVLPIGGMILTAILIKIRSPRLGVQ